MSLILVRHGKSEWNKENKFTGWIDVDLAKEGIEEAINCGLRIKNQNIDYCFTSDLLRSKKTAEFILKQFDYKIPIKNEKALKERDYGDLSGKNKDEARKEFGEEQVHKWRRGFYERPPNGENLDDVVKRVGYFYDLEILPLIKKNKKILIVAHGNSLRALLVVLGKHTKESIVNFELKTCDEYNIFLN